MESKGSDATAALEKRWLALCSGLGTDVDVAARWWITLRGHYEEVARRYHTLSHLSEMFGYFDEHSEHIVDKDAVSLAIYFHDVIYKAKAGSPKNEIDSAVAFQRFADEGLPATDLSGRARAKLIETVSRWIVQTAHHRCGADDAEDCKFFMDFDMAVLGRPWDAYEVYSRQIRQEYIHVPEAVYCMARAAFLRGAASGPPIYATDIFVQGRESQARENASREAALLDERLQGCSFLQRLVADLVLQAQRPPGKKLLGSLTLGAVAAPVVALAAMKPWAALYGAGALVGGCLLFGLRLLFGARFTRYPYKMPTGQRGIAVLAGSFNPPHIGHLEMLRYLSSAHEEVHAVIGVNPSKKYSVSPYERQELLRAMLRQVGVPNVKVVVHTSIIWAYAHSIGASVMYRGIRTWRLDGLAEKYLEMQNLITQYLCCRWPVRVVYLQANPDLVHVSSTLLRKRIAEGKDVEDLVPVGCGEAVLNAYKRSPS